MPVTWDVAADRKLLICCIEPASKPNWERVSKEMGEGYTSESCRQHFGKLKRSTMAEGSASPTKNNAGPATPTSAKKRKAKDPKDPNATPTKKGRKPAAKKEVTAEPKSPVKKEKNIGDGIKEDDEDKENKELILKEEDATA